jgi:hypothetical protein
MCQKGVNTEQMRLMIGQADDTLAMSQQWLEQIHHLADHAELGDSSVLVAQASVLLGEARAKLQKAEDTMDDGAASNASVELV